MSCVVIIDRAGAAHAAHVVLSGADAAAFSRYGLRGRRQASLAGVHAVMRAGRELATILGIGLDGESVQLGFSSCADPEDAARKAASGAVRWLFWINIPVAS